MDWTRVRPLGNGSSATVSLADSRRFGGFIAVKSVEFSQSKILQREQRILSTLSSPFVVSYIGEDVTLEKDNKLMYNLFMEYVPGGTLTDTTIRQGGRLDESLIGYYTRQVVQGLEYLHSCGLVHCDIKGRNILVGEDGAKIADFGCSRWVNQPAEIAGTPMFMAPEVARGEEQGFACDIWALGCTVIEMATGGSPWSNVGCDPVGALYRIAFSGESPEFPSFLSEQAKDFLGQCLKRNPKQRWTASQLLKHPFLEEFNSCSKQIQESNSSSCSPTSILDRGIWNSLEESETRCCENENSTVADDNRIRRLAMCSGLPDWTSDQSWVTIRVNHNYYDDDEDKVEVVGGSGMASVSYNIEDFEIPAPSVRKELVNLSYSNVSDRNGRDSFEDFKNCRKSSVDCSNFIFVRDKDKLLSSLISRC
ncbi:hypothetical protein FEM48_ZijujUnG0104100 [Ziziphus jujuba var. spinosa]|uniref:mitogen-activated protein kinase kinase kinase n=1 Tax=Ziziphus jujuba var. spinosa TaxID=714518 RepID=A0A978U863_ZIZJJ|nr:mitogen-activated protein kinase kinase kinase 18-like [Ziziphus jujuba var. spinosa]KAH7510519.1 hypothetical protein FEM48_ZijujUnG0117100 [Ziziphus jujuba var. spinosa]KAH7510639.1 hypothetical protein FEM48_ZijujUnG0104100 [Ziziphus jujuba var. spinosa]